MNDAWNRLLREARRDDWGTDEAKRVNWSAVDEGLFARIEKEQRAERRSLLPRPGRMGRTVAAGLAAALALAVVAGRVRERRSLESERATAMEDAGRIVGIEGNGQVFVGGRPAMVGTPLQLGDVVDALGAKATIGRPGRLVVAIERGSTVTVTHVQRPLVLALARGAVEAQVLPAPSGEALAIDVGPSRVAVHGTHFRLARRGDEVVVDLNEGVLSVGEAPRTGSTLGGLVTAPAHAEFVAGDAEGTLRVTHDLAAVRSPATFADTAQLRPTQSAIASAAAKADPNGAPLPAAFAGGTRSEPRTPAPESSVSAGTPAVDASAEAVVTNAVRTCMASRLHGDDITVMVSTTLYLQLYDDGSVRTARFEPPVAPDVNTCAAQSIYKARFEHGGAMTIRISVKM